MSRPFLDFDEHFNAPAWTDAALEVCGKNGIESPRPERAASSDHVVFLVDDRLVLKIFRPSRNCFEREKKALEFARGRLPFQTPEIVGIGKFEGFDYILTTRVPGTPLARVDFLKLTRRQQVKILNELAAGLKQIHEIGRPFLTDDWSAFVDERAETFIARQIAQGVNPQVLQALPQFLEKHLPTIPRTPAVFLHGDAHFGNLRFDTARGGPRIAGLFDFADSRCGFHEYDLLAVGVLMIQGQRELQREFFRAYGYKESDLNEEMRDRLMMLTMLYETSDLRRYAMRLAPEAVDYSLDRLKSSIWSFV